MEFAGKKVFFKLHQERQKSESSDEELILEEELECNFLDEITASKNERKMRRKAIRKTRPTPARRGLAAPPPAPGQPKLMEEAAPAPPSAYVREADTNVVAINFGSLAQKPEEVFPGDPIYCGSCHCVLSSTSKVQSREEAENEQKEAPAPAELPKLFIPEPPVTPVKKEEPKEEAEKTAPPAEEGDENLQSWICEFCGHWNNIDVDKEEIPTVNVRDYVLEPAPVKESKEKESENMVVFVIDASGSMGATQEVPGHLKLKGMKESQEPEFDLPPELMAEFQQMRAAQARRNVTHVSRMQCVQAAVEQQIEDWHKEKSRKRVAVISFNREVTVIGDGTQHPEIIAGDKLQDQAKLESIGEAWGKRLERPIAETYPQLSKHLFKLKQDGPTALGPALTVAVAMAGDSRGSKVILCTDGLANIGLGSLDFKEEEARERSEAWYESMGQKALEKGTAISVISIKGDECSLEAVGAIADVTGGSVERVDPLELGSNFAAMLAIPVLATNVQITFILHRGLKFRHEDVETHRLLKTIGNVTSESELTFEFGVNPLKARELQHLKKAPFQVQIFYTRPDGMKMMRVLSQSQELTQSLEEAQEDLHMEVLAANCAQQSARMAEAGDLNDQMAYNLRWGRFMHKAAKTKKQKQVFQKFAGKMGHFHGSVQRQQASLAAPAAASAEKSKGGGLFSFFSSKKAKKRAAKSARNDEDYSEMLSNKLCRRKAFL